ncbi:LysM peptidoglycan-binding domain-containing protein [Enterococcus faecalis]|uniref:LysM peptidoglycan-binding domain-containing protein n=2 Tax=Enterococcus faecalis TaxID=1351 RepID=UPI00100F23A6|nr:LysM peptidoglycan-binding domain-containing protein [Enterococcus faecalis]EGO2584070.1 LysM peptidoglycan-binding domain-containing protein [Enterococcus faecalis]EGO2590797.1 LysM peptidoglycan-binding domain-containing protein [Enterococcus faecalis]EGO2665182.1 LysM peptidoglycan-binding domain-containing protein [Enterococcus faecalis]EGO2815365.1 LysM peptidoglycan-binding domain-containing protein [Enterococcus faecalis]EGO6770590.1 LysM peptidoglycan-binding domain-containing prote
MLKKVLRFGVCISIWLVTSSTVVPSMVAVADSVAIQETIASDSEGEEKLTERSDDASDGQTEKVEVQKTETTQTTVSSSSDELSDLTQSSEETAPEEVDEFIEESLDPQEQTISHEEETKEAVDSSTSDFGGTRSSESFGEHISPSIDKPNEKIAEPVSSNEGAVVSRRSRRDLSAVSSNQSEEESVVAFDEKAFDAAIDQYIDHATEEELGLVIESSNEKEMTDALEYLLLNQLDESFGVEELDELKKFLTADEIERLENETSLETFEQLLTQYYNEREKKLEEGTAFSAFFLASTDEEIDRMLEAKDEQALEQVISEISASRNRQASGSRKKRALPLAIPLLVKGAMLVIGAGVAAYSSHQFYKTMEAQRAEKKRMVERWRYHEQQAQKRHQAAQQARAKAVARAKLQAVARAKAQATQRARAQAAAKARKQAQTWAKQQAAARARAQAAASARRKSNASYVPPVTRPKPVIKAQPKAPAKPVAKPVTKPTSPTKPKPTTTPKNTMHQVRAGESVWSISHKYGISMNDFIKWNKIKNNLIHPGQQVIVKQPASTSKPAAKPSTPATYKVKAGDSVWGICEKYGLSVSKFVQWNKIKNNTIHPGQVMHLQEPKPASKPTPKTSPTTNTTYTVKAGDSVWLIANMHGISMNDLVNWNKIKNNTIHTGQKLTVKQPVSSGKPMTKVPASTNPVTHKVSYGESLWLISSKYGVTVDELRKQNGIKGDLIHPGQVLVVKKGTTTSHSTPAGKSGTSYTVKAGDSVWLIANRYGVSMDDLVKWNKIKNYTIHPGQVLTIQTIVSTPAKPAITTIPKVEAKPAITTTPKVESKPGVITTPKVDKKPAITTTPKVKEQPVITIVPKTESEVFVEKASRAKIPKASDLKNSNTVQNHINDIIRKGANKGQLSRPYIDMDGTTLLLDEIMNAAPPVKDSILSNGLRWDVEGVFRDSQGTWELVIDNSTNTIVHFNFVK